MTASVFVPAGTAPASYPVTLQATAAGADAATTSFTLNVVLNPRFVLSEPTAFPVVNAGSTGTGGPLSIASQDGFSNPVTLSCAATYGAGSCNINPAMVSSFPATANLTINGTSFAAGSYSLSVTGTAGSDVQSLTVPFNVGDYSISGTTALSLTPASQGTANLTFTASPFYTGMINASCDASALSGTMCVLSPANPIPLALAGTAKLTATLNVPNGAAPGVYNIQINTVDASGAPSHSLIVALTLAQDFIVTSSTSSQTVTAGQTSGPYQLAVQPVGATFNGAVTLACTAGLPPQAECIFSPATAINPGSSAVDVVMSISTKASGTALHSRRSGTVMIYALGFVLPAIGIAWCALGAGGVKRKRAVCGMIVVLVLLGFCLSCGGASNGGGTGTGTPPVTYQVTVTGTSPGTTPDAGQSAVVALVVDSSE